MVVGNLVGSKMADKDLLGTIKRCLLWSALVCGVYIYSSSNLILACITVFCVGTVVAIGPAIQVLLMEVAGRAQTMAAALNHSAFNFANASGDRKSTRLNSSHVRISYAVFCLKKKKKIQV